MTWLVGVCYIGFAISDMNTGQFHASDLLAIAARYTRNQVVPHRDTASGWWHGCGGQGGRSSHRRGR